MKLTMMASHPAWAVLSYIFLAHINAKVAALTYPTKTLTTSIPAVTKTTTTLTTPIPECPNFVKFEVEYSEESLDLPFETSDPGNIPADVPIEKNFTTNDDFGSGATDLEYDGEGSNVLLDVSKGFFQVMQEYLDSNASISSRKCISKTVDKLNRALESESAIEKIGIYIPCIVKRLEKYNEKEVKRIKYGKLIKEYQDLIDEFKKEVAKKPQNLKKIQDLVCKIIDVLKKMKDCTDNPAEKAKIQAEIDRKENEKKLLGLKIKYNELRKKIKDEAAKRPRDLEKLIELYEQIMELLKKMKDCYDNKGKQDAIEKEIEEWEKIKCNVLKSRYKELVKAIKEESGKADKDLEKIIKFQKKVVEILKKIKECCAKTAKEKADLDNAIERMEKSIRINMLLIEYLKLREKVNEEAEKPEDKRDLNKLVGLYETIMKLLKKIKDLYDNKEKQDAVAKEIEIWRKLKCKVLKMIYDELLADRNAKLRKKPQDLKKILDIEKELIKILNQIKECCAKTAQQKNDVQKEIERREKNLKVLELQIEYYKLVDEFILECRKDPQDKAKILQKLNKMLKILEEVIKIVDPALKPKIQSEIDKVKREIKKFGG